MARQYASGVLRRKTESPLLFAHRGLQLEAAENTLAAFQKALDAGADVLELDVQLTADREVIVFHDDDGQRLAGDPRKISECRFDDIQGWRLRGADGQALGPSARVCRFEDVLYTFPNVPLNVDLKAEQPSLVEAMLQRVQAHAAWGRVLLTSFSTSVLRRVRARNYPGPTGVAQLEAAYILLGPRGLLHRGPKPAGARLQIPEHHGRLRLDTREMIERAHRAGYLVDYWVVNDAASAERLLDLGADGIVTDSTPDIAEVFAHHVRCRSYRGRHSAASFESASRNVGSSK